MRAVSDHQPIDWPPPGWTGHELPAFAGLFLLGAGSLIVSVFLARSGEPWWYVLYFAAVGVFVLGPVVAGVGLILGEAIGFPRFRLGICDRTGEPALVIRYPPAITLAWATMWLAGTVAIGLFVIGAVVLTLDGRFDGLLLLIPALAVSIAIRPGYLLDVVSGRIRRGALWLTPTCVVHRFWYGGAAIGWDDLREVDGRDVHGWPNLVFTPAVTDRTVTWIAAPRMQRSDMAISEPLAIPIRYLGANPLAALRLARFYLAHPAAREEIGTEAAVRRLDALT